MTHTSLMQPLPSGYCSKTKRLARFGFAAPVRDPQIIDLNILPSGWKDINSSWGRRELPKILKKMSDEETLAGGQGSILPAHKQTGILFYCLFAYTISTRRGLSTRMHKQYTRPFAQSLSFLLQNCCCISLHLYITLFFPSSLYTCHSQLTSRIPAGAPYLKLPISISSSRHAQQHSPLPAGNRLLGAPSQHRARTPAALPPREVTLRLQSNEAVSRLMLSQL